jgi:hypothetical protein
MELQDTVWDRTGLDWSGLESNKCRAPVNKVMNLGYHKKSGNFFIICRAIMLCSIEFVKVIFTEMSVVQHLCAWSWNSLGKMYRFNVHNFIKHILLVWITYYIPLPVPVAARSKMWIYRRSLADIAGSNPAGVVDVCLLWVLCFVT